MHRVWQFVRSVFAPPAAEVLATPAGTESTASPPMDTKPAPDLTPATAIPITHRAHGSRKRAVAPARSTSPEVPVESPAPIQILFRPGHTRDPNELGATVVLQFPDAPIHLHGFLVRLTADGCRWYPPGTLLTLPIRPVSYTFGPRWALWIDRAFQTAIAHQRQPVADRAAASPTRHDNPAPRNEPTDRQANTVLSKREQEVYALVQQEMPTKDIASHLNLHPATIRRHKINIRSKLDQSIRQTPVQPIDAPDTRAPARLVQPTPAPCADIHLTKREQEVHTLLLDGARFAQIAQRLGISKGTASIHVRNLRRKLRLRPSAPQPMRSASRSREEPITSILA